MTAAITGAAIGFLVWAGLTKWGLANGRGNLPVDVAIGSATGFALIGAAIGWLIGGGL